MFLIKKEYKSISRQSRSYWLLLMAFLIPFGLFYLLFGFAGLTIQDQLEGSNNKKFKVAWIAEGNQAAELRRKLELHLQVSLTDTFEVADLPEALSNDSIRVGIVIGANFDSAVANQQKANITLYYNGNSKGLSIVEKTIANYRKEISRKNIKDSNLPEGIVSPIEVTERDMSNMQEIIKNISEIMNRSVATLISLLLLVFGAIGARMGLRSLFWEEEKRGLNYMVQYAVIPYSKIYFAKMFVVSFFSWMMMLLALFGFASALSFEQQGIMEGIMLQLRGLLSWSSFVLLFVTAVPLALLFCGFWGFLGIWTKKYASFAANVSMLLLIVLFLLGSSIEINLNLFSAFIPFLSAVLVSKALFSGEYSMFLLAAAWGGSLFWALLFNYLNALKRR
jgi:hypothetical protein